MMTLPDAQFSTSVTYYITSFVDLVRFVYNFFDGYWDIYHVKHRFILVAYLFVCLGAFNQSTLILIIRASFCCIEKLKKLLFQQKLHLCTNILNDSDLLKRYMYT